MIIIGCGFIGYAHDWETAIGVLLVATALNISIQDKIRENRK